MPVRFLFGRSGSGKTHSFAERIARACREKPLGPPLIFLVPEQFSYQAEKALLAAGGVEGYCRAQVLSFTRLAEWVYARSPAPDRPRLGAAHREILTMLLLARLRREEPRSPFLRPGMEESLARFFAEAKQNAIGPGRLEEAAAELEQASSGMPGRRLAEKLRALSRLYEEFDRAASACFEDPADSFLALAENLPRLPILQGAEVFVDAFAGFTPVEERLLVALARRVTCLHIALLGDPERMTSILRGEPVRRHPAFLPLEETLERLLRLLKLADIVIEEPDALPPAGAALPRFAGSPELAHLEASFADRSAGTMPAGGAVCFLEADTPRQEARRAAEIAAAWIAAKGWRPGEIGILTRNMDIYADELREALHVLRIPVFIDRSLPLDTHPIVSGLRALVRAAVYPSRTEYILDLGKSGLLDVSRPDVDRLEYHVRQYPRPWHLWYADKPWDAPPSRSPFEEPDGEPASPDRAIFPESLDETRRALAAPVMKLRRALPPEEGGEVVMPEFLAATADCLEQSIAGRELPPGDERILQQVGTLFGQLLEACGDGAMDPPLAADLVLKTLGHLALPRIPPMLDQVFAGQVDHSRQPALKGVILLGLAEGIFPALGTNSTLLNDGERDVLRDAGLDVRPGERKLFEREWFFAYRAITSASEEMAVMRPRTNVQGAGTGASPFWNELLRCLEEPAPEAVEDDDEPGRCWRPRELAASAFRRVDRTHLYGPPAVRRVKASLLEDGDADAAREIRLVEESVLWRNDPRLDPELLAELLAKELRLSASQLASFASCPYKHFTERLLRPVETMEPEFERRDAGNYAHAFLRNFTALLRERDLAGTEIPADELDALFEQAIGGPRKAMRGSGIADSQSGALALDRLTEELRLLAAWLVESFTVLPFRPLLEEASLGRPLPDGRTFPVLEFQLAGGWQAVLRGQIDRIDTVRHQGGTCYLVVDYKLSGKSFSFAKWHGSEDLQLPLYLLAVRGASEVLGGGGVAGALYLPILPQVKERHPPGTEEFRNERKYSGMLDRDIAAGLLVKGWQSVPWVSGSAGDPGERHRAWGTALRRESIEALVAATEDKVREMAGQITSGRVDVTPSRYGYMTTCAYCGCQPLCGIDYQLNRARPVLPPPRRQILEMLDPLGDAPE